MINNKYGNFQKNGLEFYIHTKDIPRNWYNYLWNDNYITFVSQAGAGTSFLQDDIGNRIPLVNDRSIFIVEDNENWGICGLPVEQKTDSYSCTHGLGYTVIHTENKGISSDLTFFVPNDDSCEIWHLKVHNKSDKKRVFKTLAYFGTQFDTTYIRQGYTNSTSEYNEEINGLVCWSHRNFNGITNNHHCGFMSLSEKADGFEGTVNGYIGTYGSYAYPKAVRNGGLSNTGCNGEKLGYALEKRFELEPNEVKEVTFVCGIAFSMDDVIILHKKYKNPEQVYTELEKVKNKFLEQTNGVFINTPDTELNYLFNWLKHQSNLGSRWARVRHNGYRDITSDCECLGAVNPELALERFKRILSYQYSNGYAPRTFIDGKICDNNFADCTVWLTYTATSIIKEMGDKSILDMPVKFNDDTEASVYEHLRRSVEFLYNFRGLHNLIKLWGGDWNDCLNTAGLQGKGVSIWLSIAWVRAAKMFAELAEIAGKDDDKELALNRIKEMQDIIETMGWDGEYYLCAYNDWDEKVGSKECEEGKIFLIPQIWSVFSGLNRQIEAMDSAEKYLSSPLGTLVSKPAYSKFNPRLGEVTTKPAGVHENGGVYLHTIAWKIAADSILKRAENVEKDIETILPFRNKIVDGKAEPYIMCNSYFGEQTGYRYGTPGQSWRTAAGQWFEKALINYVYGLMPEMDGLKIDPCLPPSWRECSITKVFRNTTYNIKYINHGTTIDSITVDGSIIEGNILPLKDGKTVEVIVKTK